MSTNHPGNHAGNSLDQLQQRIDDDIQKLRDAQAFRTLEEKVQDLKDQGIDPSKPLDDEKDEDKR